MQAIRLAFSTFSAPQAHIQPPTSRHARRVANRPSYTQSNNHTCPNRGLGGQDRCVGGPPARRRLTDAADRPGSRGHRNRPSRRDQETDLDLPRRLRSRPLKANRQGMADGRGSRLRSGSGALPSARSRRVADPRLLGIDSHHQHELEGAPTEGNLPSPRPFATPRRHNRSRRDPGHKRRAHPPRPSRSAPTQPPPLRRRAIGAPPAPTTRRGWTPSSSEAKAAGA